MTRPPYTTRTQRYVRARARGNMSAAIRILRVTVTAMDADTLLITAPAAVLIYSGIARITTLNPGGLLSVGEEQISTRSTQVSIPYDASVPHVDDIVVVDSYGSDENLSERTFQVKGVDGGGLIRAVRTLSCVSYFESQWWEAG